ncbi:hypothetical protein GR925_03040 [Streptomyces sp. HUCO-GS316]|uniref:hypothetical protein n=1 Tax=Streptomyces sp. HUCO-GS316 TaxID=2692198 RepID=UPI00136F56CE|nr:hypothetical protein [Streptomyces sp. HUCO-GS316]MXM62450.1 hypothetical protein [Streptomyces sp. HUCO-GS316]
MQHFFAVIDIEYVDPYPWTVIPPRSSDLGPFEEWDDIGSWCREEAEDLWADRELDPGPNGIDFVARSLERCAEAFSPPGTDHWLFLHRDHPTDLPLPVFAAIGPASGPREGTLRALTLADDPNATKPPVVTPFQSERLGEGLSVFRYVRQEGFSQPLACLRYAWQVEEPGADIVIWTATEDVARLHQATADLEHLARSLAVYDP